MPSLHCFLVLATAATVSAALRRTRRGQWQSDFDDFVNDQSDQLDVELDNPVSSEDADVRVARLMPHLVRSPVHILKGNGNGNQDGKVGHRNVSKHNDTAKHDAGMDWLAAARQYPSLAFIKTPKTGGSTFSGVLRRIGSKHSYSHVRDAYWVNETNHSAKFHAIWANHGTRQHLQPHIERVMPTAFYITAVREPISRCMSEYYHFGVGRLGLRPDSVPQKLKWIEKKCWENFTVAYIRQNKEQDLEDVMGAYDFIVLTERFEESLLAFRKSLQKAGLNISLTDMLYLKAKESGVQGTDAVDNFFMPQHVRLCDEPQEVKDALLNKLGKKSGSKDATLYKRVEKQLNKYHIRPEMVDLFKRMLAKAESECRSRFTDDCFWNDNGCGQECLNELVQSTDAHLGVD